MAIVPPSYTGPPSLRTQRLYLRRPRPQDAEAVFAYASDPRVTRYMSWPTHTSLDDTHGFLRSVTDGWGTGEYAWAIEPHDGGPLLGMVGAAPGEHGVSLGYVLAHEHWGQGYATEALRAIVDDAIAQPGVYRLWACHDVDNPASGRVMQKAGLVQEALLRRWLVHPNVSPLPRDSVLYSWIRPTG